MMSVGAQARESPFVSNSQELCRKSRLDPRRDVVLSGSCITIWDFTGRRDSSGNQRESATLFPQDLSLHSRGAVPLFPRGCPFIPAGLSLLFPQGWRNSLSSTGSCRSVDSATSARRQTAADRPRARHNLRTRRTLECYCQWRGGNRAARPQPAATAAGPRLAGIRRGLATKLSGQGTEPPIPIPIPIPDSPGIGGPPPPPPPICRGSGIIPIPGSGVPCPV
jgi:hypothetical protein